MLQYLPDAEPDLDDVVRAEAMRRAKAREMSDEQAERYLEALRRSAEEIGRNIKQMEKVLRRGKLRIVK
jgi:hypothetical protein